MNTSFIIQTVLLMKSLWRSLAFTGAAFLAAVFALVITKAPLGSPVFLACFAITAGAYCADARSASGGKSTRLADFSSPPSRLPSPFACRLRFRRPGADSDMVRYVWDGRVQTLGYNPYLVLPSDPAMSATHTTETRQMPSLRARTPYPPGAQLFFRFVVGLHDSSRAMKLALVACDLLTIIVLWRWLVATGDPNGWRSRMRGTRSWCSRSRTAGTSTRSARCGSPHRRTGWRGGEPRSRRSRSSSR